MTSPTPACQVSVANPDDTLRLCGKPAAAATPPDPPRCPEHGGPPVPTRPQETR